MEASGNVALRTLACACAAGALLLCASGSPASAATSIGQLPGTAAGSCLGSTSWVQSAEAVTPSYIVPAGKWVIVSWSHRANSAFGRELGVRVWRATATPGSYTLVGAGAVRTLTPGGINTLYERITVSGGDLLGLRVGNPPGGGASCFFTAGVGDSTRNAIAASEQPLGSTSALSLLQLASRLNVIARLETDADSDGFGDETQDSCPGTAGSASGCVPPTPAPATDTTPPTAKLNARRDSIRDGRVAVWVTASEAATVTARGTLGISSQASTHRLRTATGNAVAGKRERLMLRLSKKTRRVARRALRRGKRLRVRVSVTLRDAAGNTGSAKRWVRLKR